jgi:hypothetical protein
MPLLLLVFCFLFLSPFSATADSTPAPQIKFVKNQNQWDKDILYQS